MIAQSEATKKRESIQQYFWNIVGSTEHINIPKLEDAVKKAFSMSDNRLISSSD
jgi:hypothetical protein